MRTIRLGTATEGGGKLPVAYFKDSGFPQCARARKGLFFRTPYDCDGKAIGQEYATKCTTGANGTPETVWLRGIGYPQHPDIGNMGKIVDVRGLDLMKDGCCPPELMKDYIRKERFEETEADYALEAIKLHKRGYIDGGG